VDEHTHHTFPVEVYENEIPHDSMSEIQHELQEFEVTTALLNNALYNTKEEAADARSAEEEDNEEDDHLLWERELKAQYDWIAEACDPFEDLDQASHIHFQAYNEGLAYFGRENIPHIQILPSGHHYDNVDKTKIVGRFPLEDGDKDLVRFMEKPFIELEVSLCFARKPLAVQWWLFMLRVEYSRPQTVYLEYLCGSRWNPTHQLPQQGDMWTQTYTVPRRRYIPLDLIYNNPSSIDAFNIHLLGTQLFLVTLTPPLYCATQAFHNAIKEGLFEEQMFYPEPKYLKELDMAYEQNVRGYDIGLSQSPNDTKSCQLLLPFGGCSTWDAKEQASLALEAAHKIDGQIIFGHLFDPHPVAAEFGEDISLLLSQMEVEPLTPDPVGALMLKDLEASARIYPWLNIRQFSMDLSVCWRHIQRFR